MKGSDVMRTLELPCGRCVGCRLERSRQWAIRCMHEAQLHKRNAFVTLTYSDDKLPENRALVYRDFQLFLKRARKRLGPLRFYMCGEYGDAMDRPHFHACLFGIDFDDKVLIRSRPEPLYRSATLEDLWKHGLSSTGSVTFKSAQYVARYVMKKITGDCARLHYGVVHVDTGEVTDRPAEFTRMSLKPGIGARWIERYESDVYPGGLVVVNGREVKPPRFYDLMMRKRGFFEDMKWRRELVARRSAHDNTAERLKAKEAVAIARLKFGNRSFKE